MSKRQLVLRVGFAMFVVLASLLGSAEVWAVGGRGGGGGGGGGQRPTAPRPAPRPAASAASRPATQPAARPTPRPESRPVSRPVSRPESRPQSLPANIPGGGSASKLPANRPTTLPATRPTTLPGGVAAGNRPTTLPANRPGGGSSVPNFGGGGGPIQNRRPDGGTTGGVAGLRPGADRPADLREKVSPGQLGDFLGMDDVRPRPQRPDWQKLGPARVNNIHNEWNVAVNKNSANFQNWTNLHPERSNYWNGWGAGVQANWRGAAGRPWFNDTWWAAHPVRNGSWHYGYRNQPWQYWWTVPTWAAVTSWYPAVGSTQGNYYDYGTGGNVVYVDNRVLVDGQDVASSEEFAQSAADLATVEPPADDQAAAAADWLPLGTFALSRSPDDEDLSRIVQLAVDKNGVVSGTFYNTKTDKTYTLQGRIDKQTQRVALMMADRTDLVLETGLYNLTQEEAPAMIHFGTEKSEPALLVRLKQPEDSGKKS